MSIGCVIVTYNRLEKLKIAIESFEKQTRLPDYLIIVNNKSTDNTEEYLKKWQKIDKNYKKIVITTEENLGGAGGFYLGLLEGIKRDIDWIWVSDDDAYPEKNAIEEVNNYIKNNNTNNIAAICTAVYNKDGIDVSHRGVEKKGLFSLKFEHNANLYKKNQFYCSISSYVGTIFNKEKLLEYGITKKAYFIHDDDTEHTYRLSRNNKIVCIPKMIIYHDCEEVKGEYSWKTYYGIRNRLLFLKEDVGKRYYYTEIFNLKFKLFLKKILRYKVYTHKLIEDAIYDAQHNVTGKSDIYYPGYKLK